MITDVSVDFLAVFLSAAAAFVIGFLWHGPIFGKQWISIMGFTKKEMAAAKKKGMGQSMYVQLGINIAIALVLAYTLAMIQVGTALEATIAAFWIWLGFVATAQLGPVIWERTPFKLYLINTGYHLVSLIVAANIIFAL